MSVLGIFGYGKMGKSIENSLVDFDGISTYLICKKGDSISEFIEKSDFIIDFSVSDSTNNLINALLLNPKPILIGTTDLSKECEDKILELSNYVPVMKVANVSLGANLLANLSAKISQILGEKYDIDIHDIHHKEKIDSPSGTALMIANNINLANNEKFKIVTSRSDNPRRSLNEIGISSVRTSNVPGEHIVTFSGDFDQIEIKHKILDRKLLANGALKSVLWLKDKPKGLYKVSDMFNI